MKNQHTYLIIVVLLIFSSCQHGLEDEIAVQPLEQDSSLEFEENELYQEFARSLSIAVNEEAALREFLKKEGMKMFDNDYDILYLSVKDEIVTPGGLSFYQLMTKHANNPSLIDAVEQELPLLNIYIPELPSGFSCDTWNSSDEVPLVTYTNRGADSYSVYDASGDYEAISNELIPGFPILVLKENERVRITNTNSPNARAGSGFTFEFDDAVFDGSKDLKRLNGRIPLTDLRGRVGSVASRYRDFNTAGKWQRDYVYYGIDDEDERGPFDNSYSEFINSIRFRNADGLMQISDAPNDPSPINNCPGWTDGVFEFQVTVLRSTHDGTGEIVRRVFTARGSDLFDVSYDHIELFGRRYYFITSITPKTFYPDNLEFPGWDLSVYGTAWKFMFEEFDLSQTFTKSFTVDSKLATNFDFDTSFGKEVKFGAKFGRTQERTKSETFTTVSRVESDFLGEGVVDFGDPIFIGESFDGGVLTYETRKYSTSCVEYDFAPNRLRP